MHPARTVKNAVTPRPVRQVSRAAYTVRHPVGAAENKIIGAALNAGSSRRRRSNGPGLFAVLFGTQSSRRRQPGRTASPKPNDRAPAGTATAAATARRENLPRSGVQVPESPRPKPPVLTPPATPFQGHRGSGRLGT